METLVTKTKPMPVEFHATCDCGYESRRLRENAAICRNCDEIVDVPRFPFRFDLTPCPICEGSVSEENILLNLLGKGYLITDRPSALSCPKCKSAKVQFHQDMHISMSYGTESPERGDFIHVKVLSNGRLEIPELYTEDARITFTNEVELQVGTRILARVMRIETESALGTPLAMFYERVVTRLDLKFKGELGEGS